MRKNMTIPGLRKPLTRTHQKYGVAGVAALGAAALALSLAPNDSGAETEDVSAAPVAVTSATGERQIKDVHAGITDQLAQADQRAKDAEAKLKAEQAAKAKKAAAAKAKADAEAKAEAKKKAEAKAKADREAKPAANRSVARKPVYANNLDGWIREALAVMKEKGIPGSYEGIHRNIIRESAGDPQAINNWDINAINGVPSKGLLQVIPPTFQTYHVEGTSWDIYDPVANITAACNYAADRYGSMDNVNSAY
ncbi:transglycosylase SLT domain-containing protein [Streptomyces physcomitrii]|uniref:Transglycosylase SLT domain-containing protein n=1 Tax=Streptomyces physcomitrii TaxID=2724184 RepID=A0ABX1GYI6_9ACTN|nr:transglycosylase SLT domain-containing protein [Streptomyces physcomitrii]NKI41154.1 transglycosylase SLT domain-containing protein [Streptomyces physcomitrii]